MNNSNSYILIPVGILMWIFTFMIVGIYTLFAIAKEKRKAGAPLDLAYPLPGKYKAWRWFFLCSETACLTSLAVAIYQSSHWNKYIDTDRYPVRGGIVVAALMVTPLLLLGISPFFFRSIGFRAIIAWIIAAFALVCLPFV